MKRLELQDVEKPRLFEETFPSDEAPRIRFDSEYVERLDGEEITFDFAKAAERDIHITDTTFRDGPHG